MSEKTPEFESFVATDRTYWLYSGFIAAPWRLVQEVMGDPDAALADLNAV